MKKDLEFIVVGAGIAGLSSAYHLLKNGYRVLVLEEHDGKANASFNSNAIMSHDPDTKWDLVMSKFGLSGAKLVFDVSELGMSLLDSFAHGMKPHFDTERLPAHIFSNSKEKTKKLFKQFRTYKKIGVPASFSEDGTRLHKHFDAYLTIPGEGQTNNQAILKNLAAAIRKKGGSILKNKKVVALESDTHGVMLKTEAGDVYRAREVVIATGSAPQFLDLELPIEVKRTFVVEYRKHRMPELFRSSVLWDNDEPYHYIRSFRKFILWVGGNDVSEKDFNPKKDYFKAVDLFARDRLGLDQSFKREKAWSGTFYPAKRGLPYIGKVPGKPIWVNVGFGGTGIVMTFVSGYLIASWKKGREKKYQKLFSIEQ